MEEERSFIRPKERARLLKIGAAAAAAPAVAGVLAERAGVPIPASTPPDPVEVTR